MGGMDALIRLCSPLPAGFPLPLVAVQHRSIDSSYLLCELLQRQLAIEVAEAEDKTPIRPGRLLVAPPDYHLMVEAGVCCLSTELPVHYARPSIEVFFESIAWSYGSGAICVVLTSASSDGAAGAALIKQRGGIVLVQDPLSCEAPVLPRATLRLTTPDFVGQIEEISARLQDLARPVTGSQS